MSRIGRNQTKRKFQSFRTCQKNLTKVRNMKGHFEIMVLQSIPKMIQNGKEFCQLQRFLNHLILTVIKKTHVHRSFKILKQFQSTWSHGPDKIPLIHPLDRRKLHSDHCQATVSGWMMKIFCLDFVIVTNQVWTKTTKEVLSNQDLTNIQDQTSKLSLNLPQNHTLLHHNYQSQLCPRAPHTFGCPN